MNWKCLISQPIDSNGYMAKPLFGWILLCWILLAVPVLVEAETTSSPSKVEQSTLAHADPTNKQLTERGQRVYKRFCAVCHGVNLQGQPNWRRRNANGKLPAPPHNAEGHTWHHADKDLFAMIKFGMVPPYAPQGYITDMPAWKDVLKDNDIWSVIAFIKSTWPKHVVEHQQQISAQSIQQSSPR